MYDDVDYLAKRVVRGDKTDGPDSDTKDKISWTVDGYADSTDLIGEDQRGFRWRSQVARIQRLSGSWVKNRHVDPCGWNNPFW